VPVPDYPTAGLADVRERQDANLPVLTLGEAVLTALRDNPTPRSARAAVAAALARAGQAASAGKIQVNIAGSATNQRGYLGSGTPTGGANAGTGTGITTNTGTANGLTGFLGGISAEQLSLNASVPLYEGGRIKNSRRAAEATARAALLDSQETEQTLAAQTILAYLSILQNRELLDVATANFDTTRERRRIAGVRYYAGAAAALEVLQADSDLQTAAQRRIASANNVAQSSRSRPSFCPPLPAFLSLLRRRPSPMVAPRRLHPSFAPSPTPRFLRLVRRANALMPQGSTSPRKRRRRSPRLRRPSPDCSATPSLIWAASS